MNLYYQLQVITHSEFGATSSRSLKGRYADKADALAASVDYGQQLAGPVREDYRRPTVAVEFDEYLGATVKVGSGDDDGQYHVIYAMELGRAWQPAPDAGRGYVVCKLSSLDA